jgi:deoxyribose-phosphate aldolase
VRCKGRLDQIVKASLGRAKVKAVFEHCVYTDEEKQAVLNMIKDCGAEYIKIQNVLSGKGADVADIRYVKNILGRNIKIKIDGGVKTLEKACELIAGGADRIGLTATVAIAKEAYAAK